MAALIDLVPLPYPDAVVAVGAALLGLTAGVVGTFAVLRRRSLVGDALAHATLPGVALAFLVTGAKDVTTLLAGAALAGLVGAVLIDAIERTGRVRPDAAIGVVLSSFFAIGIVLLTYLGTSGDASQAGLDSYLFGQAAGLLERDVATFAVLAGAALVLVGALFRPLKTTLFDPGFAGSIGLPVRALELLTTVLLVVAVIVGVRTVGAILMVAMLVTPAVAARQVSRSLAGTVVLAGAAGAAVGVTGALLSSAWEAPTGPVVTLVGVLLVLVAVLGAPGRGVLWRARRLRRARRRRATEGLLVDLETAMHAGPPPTVAELAAAGGRPRRSVARAVADLDRAGLLAREDGRLHLNEAGAAAAHAVLERRDLWTAWLEHGWRLELADAREPDPSDVRATLGDAAAERLRALAAREPA